LLDRWDAPLINDFLCMAGFGASRALLGKWAGEAGLTFHNDVMIGQGGIVSAEPARRIAAMGRMVRGDAAVLDALGKGREALADHPALDRAVADYLADSGDRCTEELKLESLPLSEEPGPLLNAIASAAHRPDGGAAERPEPHWAALVPDRPVTPITSTRRWRPGPRCARARRSGTGRAMPGGWTTAGGDGCWAGPGRW